VRLPAIQRPVRIGALVVIPQYGWVDEKWVRRANVYEIRRPRFDARVMPLFKRVRGVKKAAKDLVADVAKSFRPGSKVSEAEAESDRDRNTISVADTNRQKQAERLAARTVFGTGSGVRSAHEGLSSEERRTRERQEAAWARFEALRQRKQQASATA
jgi:hypothetical protein